MAWEIINGLFFVVLGLVAYFSAVGIAFFIQNTTYARSKARIIVTARRRDEFLSGKRKRSKIGIRLSRAIIGKSVPRQREVMIGGFRDSEAGVFGLSLAQPPRTAPADNDSYSRK